MIGIVDYGMGNIKAFCNIYKNLDIAHKTVSQDSEFEGISKIILPGVGAFDYAMSQLHVSGMFEKLNSLVLDKKMPLLGICVGMQMLAEHSEEGELAGLGWIDASVNKFDNEVLGQNNPLPHMGWNTVKHAADNPLFENIKQDTMFYFLHSYFFNAKQVNTSIAMSNYGNEFTCAVNSNNIFGVQFHPEKSHQGGIQLLKNFAEL